MRRFFIWLLLTISFAVYSAPAPELTIVRGNKNYPPFEIYYPDEPLSGFHIDLVTAVADILGVKITFVSVPWRRAIYMIDSGQADAITYIGKTPERERFAIFKLGNRISYSVNAFFVRKQEIRQINYTGDFKEINGYMLGKVLGYSYGTKFDDYPWISQNNSAKDEMRLLDMLLAHHIDIGVGNKDRVAYFATKTSIRQDIAFLSPAFKPIPQYLAFSKKSPNHEWANIFARAIKKFTTTEAYQQLLAKYQIEVVN